MAGEDDTTPLANGNADTGGPQVAIVGQYVKDLSFENPNAPASLQAQGQPQIDIQVNVSVNRVGEEVFEVGLKVEARATVETQISFAIDVLYAGLFGLRNVPEEAVEPFLLVEAPRILFPFARRVIADATRDGGFPPLLLEPIDFSSLYAVERQRAEQIAAEPAAGEA